MKQNKAKDALITIGVSVGVLAVVWGVMYGSQQRSLSRLLASLRLLVVCRYSQGNHSFMKQKTKDTLITIVLD